VIFLLGCKGFLGSAFSRYFQEKGMDFSGIDLDNYQDFSGKSCDILINANGNSRKYLAGEDPKTEFKMSVQSVLDSITDFPCRRYIMLSSVDVYTDFSDPARNHEETEPDPRLQSAYGFHKYLAEQIVRKYKNNWIIFRLGGMVGKNMVKSPVYDILNGKSLRVDAASEYQYINTLDVADIVMHICGLQVKNEVFNLSGRGTMSLRRIAEIAGKNLTSMQSGLPVQRYEINNIKISGMVDVPDTWNTVKQFISEYLGQ